ncbi:MAG: hypothetical protein P1S60_15215, partial [Anaerolineae bacterium]|nr:hypothetical protein [Anaerolineae bacterium]
ELVKMGSGAFQLPAASRKAMSIALDPQALLQPGIYNGWITLSTGQPPTVIRKSVRLAVPVPQIEGLKSDQSPGSAPPAVAAYTLQAYRLLPGMRPMCIKNLSFLCAVPLKTQNPPAVTQTGTVGTLNGSNSGGLDVAIRQTRRSQILLDLDFTQALAPVGAYAGNLDFLPGTSGGELSLTVNVKDTFLTPLIAVGLGILLAQWAQFYLTVRRGLMQVERRLAQVTVDFEAVPNEVISGYTIKNDVAVQREAIQKALADWAKSHMQSPAAEDTARFEATVLLPLEKLEGNVKDWAAFDDRLEKLRKTLELEAWPVIRKSKPPSHLNLDAPRFYLVAQTLLHGRPISLHDFGKRQVVIDEAMAFASQWGELEAVRATIAEAHDFVSQYRFQLSDIAQHDLEIARRKLSEAHRELWEAETLTRLRVLRTTDDLEEAKAIVNQLMGLVEAGPPGKEDLLPGQVELVGPWSAEGGTLLGRFDMSVLRNLRARLWAIVPPALKPADLHTAEGAKTRILWLNRALLAGDLVLVLLAYLAAVVAGLKPYFTTNFGTWYDYMSAFTWGFGAKAAVELINALLEKVLTNNK